MTFCVLKKKEIYVKGRRDKVSSTKELRITIVYLKQSYSKKIREFCFYSHHFSLQYINKTNLVLKN